MENQGLLIVALVAVVSVVALVMLASQTGGVVVIEGSAHTTFDRPYGSSSEDIVGENQPCYEDAEGQIRCDFLEQ